MNNALIASFWEAGWFARLILIALFVLSISTWGIIALKWRMLNETARQKENFFAVIRRTRGSMLSAYKNTGSLSPSPFIRVYKAVCEEIDLAQKTNRPGKIGSIQINNLSDTASCAVSDEIMSMEKYMLLLATTASISPLLGLLGTVWGVLISFRGMASIGTASISVIAPGISEALVTTVAGLIVAIPALVGYNLLMNKIQVLSRELENFSLRLISYIQSLYTVPDSYEKNPVY